MRVLFIGTVKFSESCLKKLISMQVDIVGVITKQKSNFNSDFVDLSHISTKNKIPFLFSDDINSLETSQWIEEKKTDIIFCFGWSSLIKKQILKIPKKGIVGFHPAKLPQNRGRHPIIWALALGLKQTASTFFFMEDGPDSGDIISQQIIVIDESDDASSLYDKITTTAISQLVDFVPLLIDNTLNPIPQEHNKSNIWRKRGKMDGQINWNMSKIAIYNLVRALTKPYIGAHTLYENDEIKIWKVIPKNYNQTNIEPGKVLKSDKNSILVRCYDGAIEILDHDFNSLPKVGHYL